jgi:GNAT superfamily N-acetyltransferase
MPAIRPARVGEAETLTALCVRSKAHWGYDQEFMRLSAPSLRVSSTEIAIGRVIVALDDDGNPVGVASVSPQGANADLSLFFVDPSSMGQGIGRALFAGAIWVAQFHATKALTILADPNAAAFYERMGARFLRNAPSDAIPGRTLPLYEYDLASEEPGAAPNTGR